MAARRQDAAGRFAAFQHPPIAINIISNALDDMSVWL
jgi:hypothetical protein